MSKSAIVSAKPIRAKGTCCKDRPRCKKCPVVLKRLTDAGLGERLDKRTYVLDVTISKKQLKAARRGDPIPGV